jgi:glycosyltransferase involved in cell wall biosynthesis
MIFARRQAQALARLGIRVEVFGLRSRTLPWMLAAEFFRFRKTVARMRPRVIHAHFGTMTAAFAAAAAGKIPLVITYRGGDLNPAPGERWPRAVLGRWLSQAAALCAARIVCVSRELRERLWWRHQRVTVLPTGVDEKIFRPGPRTQARRSLGWTRQERVVLFNAGHNPRIKRLDLAEAAAAVARRRVPNLRLEILDGRVAPDRVPLLMNASDCLLITSDTEGSPAVVAEALATNLPIVSVEVGDVAQQVEGVRHARMVARSPEALGRAVAEVVRQPLRSDGRRKMDAVSGGRMARELCRLYREAAAEIEMI